MNMKERMKRVFSILICLCMVLTLVPTTAFAVDAAEGGLCEHHTEHTAQCHYAEAVEGQPCTHVHDELCGYIETVAEVKCACEVTDENGALVHTEGCGYVAPVTGADCTHNHDEACGYVAAVEAHDCHYECAECAAEKTTAPAPVCDCGTDDALIHAVNCAVYVAPENPQCFCAEKCSDINIWCDVCGFDYTACTGTDTAAAYEDAVTLPRLLYVGGVEVINEYVVGAVTSGTGWSFDAATGILYLTDGADIRYSSTTEDYLENGICCVGGTLNIHASGNVSITGYSEGINLPDGSLNLYAAEGAVVTISAQGARAGGIDSTVKSNVVAFSGKGTVNVRSNSDYASYGISAAGDIKIDGITLNVWGGGNYHDISGARVLVGQTKAAVVNCLSTTCSGIGGSLTQKIGIYNGSTVHVGEKVIDQSWLTGFGASSNQTYTIEIVDSNVIMDGLTGTYSIYALHGNTIVSGNSHVLIRKMVSTSDDAHGLTTGSINHELIAEQDYYCRTDSTGEFALNAEITELYIPYFELYTSSHYKYHNNGDGTHYYGCPTTCPVAIKGENEACGGTVTCKELAVCDLCGATHGELLPHTPVADSYQDIGDGKHSFTCAVCGTATEDHTWAQGVCIYCKVACAHDHHEDGVCTTCGEVCTHDSYENGECAVCGTACVHSFDATGLCNVCDLRKVWLKTSSWEAPTIFCSDTSLEIPMTKDTETGLWYGYVPETLEGFIFRSLYVNPYSGNIFCSQTNLLSLPENANCYRVAGSPSTSKDETYTYYTYGGNWYFHPCTEHTWESGQCSLCGLMCSHTGGEQTCDGYQCEVCGSWYGEKLPHNFYDGTGKCLECGEFLAVLQETKGSATIYYSLDQIASGKTFQYGGTLKLLTDIHMEEGKSLELGFGEFTLDLNGYTLYSTNNHAVYVREKLTVMDSSSAGNGQIRSSNSDTGSTTGYPTAALYGTTDYFHITVVGDVELNGIVTFLSANNAGSGVIDLTQWDNAVDSSVHVIYGTSAIYSSVLLPASYGLTYQGTFVSSTFPVRASATLLVAKCNNHAGGTATCSKKAECVYCGESYGELAPDNHSTTAEGDTAATCTTLAYCSVCQSKYGEVDLNNHESEEFTYIANEDGTTHKKVHKCCKTTAVEAEPHTFDSTTGKCAVCGQKQYPIVTAPVANEKSIYFGPTNQEYYGLMYCGKEQELVTGGSAEGGTMVYSLEQDGEFTETVPTAKNAGTYTVYYKVLGDETHSDTNVASVTVTMEKAPAFIMPTNQVLCLDYDCSNLSSGMRNCIVPYYDGNTILYPDVELTFTTDAEQGVKGDYTIFISGPTEDDNYIYTYENGILSLVDHIFHSYSGKCSCGLEMAAASTTVDDTTTYYLTVQEALDAAAQAESAEVNLLRSDENVTGLTMFGGNVRLAMNGWTLKGSVGNNGILQLYGTELTVDGGTIENTSQYGYGVYAAYNDETHLYSTIRLIGSDVTGINAGICTYKAHVEVADSTVTGTEYGICARNAGAITLESGTISGKIGVATSMNGGTLYMGAEGTSNGPTINGQTHGIFDMGYMYAYAGTINCPTGFGIVLGEHYSGSNNTEGAGLYLEGLPTINAATDIYVNYSENLSEKRCIQVNVELPEGAYSVDSWCGNEVIAKPGTGITLKRTWFTSANADKFVQNGMHGNLTLGPCAHGDKKGVQNADGLTHDIFCNICLTTPEEDVACSGGTATCINKATCTVCGELYGDVGPHTEDTELGQTCKGYFCTVCRTFYGATAADSHKFNSATGECDLCGSNLAVASTTVGGTGTYYETLAEAIAAAAVGTKDAPATVMVLKNIDLTETIEVNSGVFTLNLNGKTLRDYECDGLFNGIFSLPSDSTAHMTIADAAGGKLLADWGVVEVSGGTVTITGGDLSYEGNSLGDSVSIDGGTLNISGGTFLDVDAKFGGTVNISGGSIECIRLFEHITANISGGSIRRLMVESAESNVKLSGGAFEYIDCVNAVSKLLADGYSYWNQEGTTMLDPAENSSIFSVSVKATCYHPAEKLTYTDNSDGTHTRSCSGCANTVKQTHLYAGSTHQCVCGAVEKFLVTWTTGDGGSYEKEFAYGQTVTIPTNEFFRDTFRKTGYNLSGWDGYTEGMTMPGEDLTFTAQYTPIEYTITWEMNGCGYSVNNYHELPTKLAYNVDSTAHNINFAEITAPEGYEFVRFEDGDGNALRYDNSDHYKLFLTVSGDMTVKAVIEPKTYMATWTTGDGDNYEKTFKYGETVTIPTSVIFQETFRKTGHTLTGWEGYTEGMTMPAGDVTFTAIYEVNVYTITFDTDGGSSVAPISQAYGTQILAPAAPIKDGYHFVKWEALPATVPAGDLTVKAVWEAHYGGEATCVSGKLCEVCFAEYTDADANAHGKRLYTISQDGATCTVSCSLCQKVLETLTLVAPACKTYGDGKSCEVTVLLHDTPVTEIDGEVYFQWENDQWNKLEAAPTNAGTYRAEIYNVGAPNDTSDDFTLYVEYTIAQKQVTPVISGTVTKVYDGTNTVPAGLTITLNGMLEGDAVNAKADYAYDGTDVGTTLIHATNITLSGEATSNYTLTANAASAEVGTITKAPAPAITFPTVLNEIPYGAPLSEAQLSFYGNDYGTFNWAAAIGVPNAGIGDYALDFCPDQKAMNNYIWQNTSDALWIEERSALCAMGRVVVNKVAAEYEHPGFDQENAPIYNGALQSLVTPGSTEHGTMVYSLSEDGPYTETIPMVKDAGQYQIWFKVIGDENHTDIQPQYITTWMQKAPLWVTANDSTITYGDAPANAGVQYQGFVGNDTAADLEGELTYTYGYSQYGDVGTYTITPAGLESVNYTAHYTPGTLMVNPKSITVKADSFTKVYSEADPILTYQVEGMINGDELSGELLRVTGEDVGTYAITQGALTAGGNYNISFTGAELTIHAKTITAADVKLDGSLTYTGSELTQKITAAEGITYEVSGNKATGVGTYELTVKGTGNFTGEVKLGWSIQAATAVVGTAPIANNLTYTGKDQTLVTAGTTADGTLLYKLGENGTYSATVPSAVNAGTYTVYYYVKGDSNHEDSAEQKIDVTLGQLDITGKTLDITLANTLTYNGAEQTMGVSSVKLGDMTVTYGVSGNTGTNATGYTLTITGSGNFKGTATKEWSIAKKSATITAKDQTITYGETISGTEITADGLVDGHSVTVTLTPSTANVTVSGTITADAAVITADGTDVTNNYIVSYTSGKLVIEPDTSKIAGLTTENVTSANEEDIKAAQEMMENADSVKDEWNAIEDTCEELIDRIEEVQAAISTDAIQKVEDITAENVKPEDKEVLADAKADLEKALEDNAGNYTEEEKQTIQEKIQRIEDAVDALENAQDVTEAIQTLPETVEPDDEETAEKILDVKSAYDELTDHEKTLVEETAKEKLDGLVANLTAYDIIKGDGGKWRKGSSYGLSFTANGLFSKFVGIEVDGKEVASTYYTAESGSTIITLQQSFLKGLSNGKHTITVLYTDGETSGTFMILAKSTSPETGDDSNLMLYGSMLTVSLAGIVVLLLAAKKRKQKNA